MKVLPAITPDGHQTVIQTQCADVSLPLSSVGEYCDAGNFVGFGPKGGFIQNVGTGQTQLFERDADGVYVLEYYVPAAASMSGFARPGAERPSAPP